MTTNNYSSSSTIENRNFLSPLDFKFIIKKAPAITFFTQKVNLPSITLNAPEMPTPFVKIPFPGDHIDFGTLDITFKVDEDLQNYLEIKKWLYALGKPQYYDQYEDIASVPLMSGDGITSDLTLIPLTGTKAPNFNITFIDAFPWQLSGFSFNTIDSTVNYVTASASFKFTYFLVDQIK